MTSVSSFTLNPITFCWKTTEGRFQLLSRLNNLYPPILQHCLKMCWFDYWSNSRRGTLFNSLSNLSQRWSLNVSQKQRSWIIQSSQNRIHYRTWPGQYLKTTTDPGSDKPDRRHRTGSAEGRRLCQTRPARFRKTLWFRLKCHPSCYMWHHFIMLAT